MRGLVKRLASRLGITPTIFGESIEFEAPKDAIKISTKRRSRKALSEVHKQALQSGRGGRPSKASTAPNSIVVEGDLDSKRGAVAV